jgi:predicted O-methyltransferase YrrM
MYQRRKTGGLTLFEQIITTRAELCDVLRSQDSGVIRVKPRVIFQTVEETLGTPVALSLQIPSSGIGSITTLEAALLVSLVRLSRPKCIVEIGTYLGYSCRLFLDNSDDHSAVISIDLPDDYRVDAGAGNYSETVLHTDHQKNDEFLRLRQQTSGTVYLSNLDSQLNRRLHLIKADTMTLGASEICAPGSADFVFIDGGHEQGLVHNDSRLAAELIGTDGVIAWHDFGSSIHVDVTQVVGNLAKSSLIISMENTLLALQLQGHSRELFVERNKV